MLEFIRLEQKDDTSQYFLANRNLGWFVIGASLFASNIGSEHSAGLAESGFKKGLIESQFEILAAFMLLILGWFLFHSMRMVLLQCQNS